MSSSASSNKRSTWKRLCRPDPLVTSLCNQFAKMSISALSNKRLRRPDPSVTNEMIEQGMKMSSSSSCAPEKEESSSNSSAPKKEESSSNSSEPKVMASTSTTPIQKRFKYDVFLSFRGEDTRNNFLGHLYEALNAKGIYTYKDDVRIRKGKTINDELIKAIEDSRFYIIVFSKNYASSSWCLDELVKIMECQKKDEHTAYPVFYDVEPTEVRNQSGAVENAFSNNKEKEAAEKWKGALKEAADLAGWGLNDGDVSELIKKIVGLISQELRSISFGSDEKLVGMVTRVKDVVDSLEMGIDDDVRMIGIKGMGGAGKTTTARAVFDRLSADFEAKSFVANVREVSQPSLSGLKKLQEQVLSRVLNEQVTLDSVYDGKNMMQERMRGIKVLLVLDDVDHIEQLEALAGGPNWFKPGSRIIVTTRNEQVLEAHRVNFRDHRVKIRDIDLLSYEEAIFLLSRHAFGRESPSQGFEKLSEKVASYAVGLPLTLKVLGSFLCGKDEHEWKDAIERLKEIPLPEEIQEKLELSYTSLEKDYKEIFLDIACILKGEHKDDAIRILECCGFRARIGLKVLEQRSLITVDKDGFLGMHDHIEEMGKNIVRREHRDEPNKHSRLWVKEEIDDILANDKGTEATICLAFHNWNTNAGTVMNGLGKMKQLRYLKVYFVNRYYAKVLDNTAQYFSNSLKYLKCWDYPFLYLPKTFQANNLVGLDIAFSRMVQLWEEGEKKVLPKLKFFSLLRSNLTTIDFRITPNLETLSINYEHSLRLVKLFMPVSCQKLNYLYICSSKLRTFDLGLTPNLEKLSLDDCADFEELHVSTACPNLKFLELVGKLRLRSLDLELFPNLEKLDLKGCVDFEELQVSSACQNLKFLELGDKLRLRSLDLELFPNLEKLDLKGCVYFEELHVSSACPNLKFLELGGKLRLRSLDLELFPNLEKLDLKGCVYFEELHMSSACPNLKFLELSGKLRLRSLDLELFPNLERLDLEGCDKFKYDVFLSFRGEDTRNNFLGHLYEALTTKGIVTYKDDVKIRKGKTISDELIKAIEDSRFYIIVFSKNYASSSWCLDELVKIMQCQKKDEHTAYPVFYDVEPTEVRNQSGAVENAFSKNKEKEAAEKWKGALKEAADLAGWGLNDGVESELIKKIVGLISLELRSISFGFDDKLVGMETRVKDVVSSLEAGIDEVRMIGIKTTTARAVFDHLSNDFEAKSFVGNVREVSSASPFGLKNLQEQVLSNVLNEHVTLNSVEDGKNMMKKRMCGIKVLLVLDDVDDMEQLDALAGQPNWFKPGSKIIITTRYEQVLVAHRVNVCDIKVHDINLLSYKETICLFSGYAFGRENPLQGYEELSGKSCTLCCWSSLGGQTLGFISLW